MSFTDLTEHLAEAFKVSDWSAMEEASFQRRTRERESNRLKAADYYRCHRDELLLLMRERFRRSRGSFPAISCGLCGAAFVGRRGSLFCSKRCVQKKRAVKAKERRAKARAGVISCADCGTQVERRNPKGGPTRRFCSGRCRDRIGMRRRRARAKAIEGAA